MLTCSQSSGVPPPKLSRVPPLGCVGVPTARFLQACPLEVHLICEDVNDLEVHAESLVMQILTKTMSR